jgi:hypothetical protein
MSSPAAAQQNWCWTALQIPQFTGLLSSFDFNERRCSKRKGWTCRSARSRRARRACEGAAQGEGSPQASEPGCGAEPHRV